MEDRIWNMAFKNMKTANGNQQTERCGSLVMVNALRVSLNFLIEKRREEYQAYFDRAFVEKKFKMTEEHLWRGWLCQSAERCVA